MADDSSKTVEKDVSEAGTASMTMKKYRATTNSIMRAWTGARLCFSLSNSHTWTEAEKGGAVCRYIDHCRLANLLTGICKFLAAQQCGRETSYKFARGSALLAASLSSRFTTFVPIWPWQYEAACTSHNAKVHSGVMLRTQLRSAFEAPTMKHQNSDKSSPQT